MDPLIVELGSRIQKEYSEVKNFAKKSKRTTFLNVVKKHYYLNKEKLCMRYSSFLSAISLFIHYLREEYEKAEALAELEREKEREKRESVGLEGFTDYYEWSIAEYGLNAD